MSETTKFVPTKNAHLPVDYNENIIMAVRAVSAGVASESQQKLFFDYLLFASKWGKYSDISYRPGPDGDRETAFAEGRRFVGQQISKLLAPEFTPSDHQNETKEALTRRQIAQRMRRAREANERKNRG
jgi:hypothetical protein